MQRLKSVSLGLDLGRIWNEVKSILNTIGIKITNQSNMLVTENRNDRCVQQNTKASSCFCDFNKKMTVFKV